ncbi:L,D-transpeptidase family protein [Sphingomonas sp. Leaf34]|uniref:L,D-transpeptidase family protein n=1 Tax=Sphingomonas sp. Leaf34 TaxID=1736216 RepID=UPI0009EB7FD1|nr:L,D-transpeptidase family protein [Sphingomonas sp. Leaf34]
MTIRKLRARLAVGVVPFLGLTLAGPAVAQDAATPAIAAEAADTGKTADTAGPVKRSAVIDKQTITDPVLRGLYAKAGWRGLWSTSTIAAFDQVLADRARHGLDQVIFLPTPTEGMTAADTDIARTKAALDYATALAQGRVDPTTLQPVYTLPRPKADLVAAFARALAKGDLAAWFASLPPQDPEYRQLSDAYLAFSTKAAAETHVEAIPAGLIRVGNRDPRVVTIVEQLVESGYLAAPSGLAPVSAPVSAPAPTPAASPGIALGTGQRVAPAAPLYTSAIAEAMKGLQTDYGIAADGVVGPETLKVLNLGAGDRARALAVGLERRRWLARTPPATRIDVNTAAAQLRYYRDGTMVDQRKVIVGEAGHETPPLFSPIYRLVANPTWTVPKSIQNGEMANVGEEYLAAHDMVMRDGWIVQQPGPSNALGLVKFDMANDQAIYLHDTSAPALFDRSQRHLSHGCVRVEDALGFAQTLAEDEGVTEAWQTAQNSGEMTFVPLPRRIPVRLLYHNVYVDDGGRVAFRTDPYGWNDPIAEQLGFAKASAKRAEAQAIDIGP